MAFIILYVPSIPTTREQSYKSRQKWQLNSKHVGSKRLRLVVYTTTTLTVSGSAPTSYRGRLAHQFGSRAR